MPTQKPTVSRKIVRQRSLWLLVLFLVAGSFSFPKPFNWLLGKVDQIVGIDVGQVHTPFVLGLDLQGGTHLEYEADVSKIPATGRSESLQGVRDVIERRVNSLGVSEPLIQTTHAGDSWRVTVELAGISDINQAIDKIGKTPILEFKEQNTEKTRPLTAEEQKKESDLNKAAMERAAALLVEAQKPGADFEKLAREKSENATLKTIGGDAGFIKADETLTPIYAELSHASATGTVLPKVFDLPHYYTIAKLEEIKNDGTEISGQQILISFKGATGTDPNSGAPIDISTLTRDQAKEKIDALKKQLTVANFDKLAAENSQEPGAADTKGSWGWIAKVALEPTLATVVSAQKDGTISDVFESPFGFHIVLKKGERALVDPRVRLIQIKKTTDEDLVPPADPWKETNLTGRDLKSSSVEFDQQTGAVQIALQFNDTGAKLFQEITKRNVGKPIAIFLDGELTGNPPIVREEIAGGRASISGNYSLEEAKAHVRELNAGALPVPIRLIAQQTVGPTLGADSLTRSLKAGLVGFLLIALFMVLLYRLPGLISIAALILYAALSAAFFKLIPVTMTLSGIAGAILSLGIAVDANVLVFERLKEEWREGKPIGLALEDAFRRAWPSIRDGHVTILISCAVLYWFSSSVLKGFALTLAVGTLTSLFTAIVATRTILRLLAGTKLGENGWLFLKPSDPQKPRA